MQIDLRIATKDDSARISEIYLASRRRYLPYAPLAHTDDAVRSWIRDQLIPAGNVTLAIVDGVSVGFLATSRDGSHSWIDHLYLDPGSVGIGIGSLLINEAKRLLGEPIRLYTFQQNEDARRLYRRHGFREVQFSDGASNEEKTPDVLLEWP